MTGQNVLVRIPDSTLEQVKVFISDREKGLYKKGMIMELINDAVLSYIGGKDIFKNGDSTHTQNNRKALKLQNKIMNWLKTKYNFETFEEVIIAKPMLEEAIIAVEGITDKMTINNRISLLKTDCIKEAEDSDKENRRYTFIMSEDRKEDDIECIIQN